MWAGHVPREVELTGSVHEYSNLLIFPEEMLDIKCHKVLEMLMVKQQVAWDLFCKYCKPSFLTCVLLSYVSAQQQWMSEVEQHLEQLFHYYEHFFMTNIKEAVTESMKS